ncbi:MAG TPA: hypothetical protein VLQ45_02050 [Thermoanaerobaculia bacterium]|nr:hypothetical protein [Thermoanaerobaculia bacterium]
MAKPFRWNIKRREQLGGLVEGSPVEIFPGLIPGLRHASARILALSEDSDLVFVGRSPESFFDYLSGMLHGTSWAGRLCLLNVSMRHRSLAEIREQYPEALPATYEHFQDLGLSPERIASRERKVALVDLVDTGSTFGALTDLLLDWARRTGCDENAVRRQLRFVGVTIRTQTSPKTVRWHQQDQAAWVREFRPSAIKNVSIPLDLWSYLGNSQRKVARTNPPEHWGEDFMLEPPRESYHLQAVPLARYLFYRARSREERKAFAARLAKDPAMSRAWYRALALELAY